jgi:serine/threonine protein phosphatase PrpC
MTSPRNLNLVGLGVRAGSGSRCRTCTASSAPSATNPTEGLGICRESRDTFVVDQNLMVLGGALVTLLGSLVFSWRRAASAAKRKHERDAPQQKGKLVVATEAPRVDEDLEITKVMTFPRAELAKFAEANSTGADGEPDGVGAAPNLSIETAELEFEDCASRVKLSFEEDAEVEEATSPNVRILISAWGATDQGRKRKRNEDSLLVFPERSMFAVADGMGGHAGGEVASALAVDVIRDAFERNVFDARTESAVELPRRGQELACAIHMANQAIYSMGQSDPQLREMGTTVIAARFSPNKQRVYIGHVGDSRCYRLRGSVLRQLTSDHTMSTFGVTGPHQNELFQAVGVQPILSIDLIVDKPRGNDLYLLCSDGLNKMASDEELREILLHEPNLEAAVNRLIQLANEHGGRDNTTLILVKVLERATRLVTPSA